MTRLSKPHMKDTTPIEDHSEVVPARDTGYRIPLTPAALLRRTKECRHAMGAELKEQMEMVKRHLSREPTGDADEECDLHAEIELMRQAILRLCRE